MSQNVLLIKMDEVKPSAPLLCPNISSLSEEHINDIILANSMFNNTINIVKAMKNYYGAEIDFPKKKLSR